MNKSSAAILASGAVLSMLIFGLLVYHTATSVTDWQRTVTVKGLAEQEYPADTVLWPVTFSLASNDVNTLYQQVDAQMQTVSDYFIEAGLTPAEITRGQPVIIDKLAQQYGNTQKVPFRYTATATVTLYSQQVEKVRTLVQNITELGKQGIVFTDNYNARIEYVFSSLNAVKPEMIEQATVNARQVAQKFARDSESTLGKIKRARQGQFTISDRDRQHPHIKKVRVVSTVEYTLID